ncbi:uncharacterized protein [Dermacentor andersoni]|uniref:uncharacterized protein n=1 Tax=Dermacentor andersoni TaxID=34620 RepID=UPI002415D1C3|nr:phosphatidylinositol 3-kinase 2-like [Dermacentor andersoni]
MIRATRVGIPKLMIIALNFMITFSQAEMQNNEDDYDIKLVLNTEEKLWLYQQNYNSSEIHLHGTTSPYTCLYMMKTTLKDNEYNFTETLRYSGKEDTFQYYGKLVRTGGNDKPMNALEVFKPPVSDKKYKELILKYYSEEDPKCSIFFVSSLEQKLTDSLSLCEMYIRGDVIEAGPPEECMNVYNQTCKYSYRIYTDDCKKPVPTVSNNIKPTKDPRPSNGDNGSSSSNNNNNKNDGDGNNNNNSNNNNRRGK